MFSRKFLRLWDKEDILCLSDPHVDVINGWNIFRTFWSVRIREGAVEKIIVSMFLTFYYVEESDNFFLVLLESLFLQS